jgi:hypothetical protein
MRNIYLVENGSSKGGTDEKYENKVKMEVQIQIYQYLHLYRIDYNADIVGIESQLHS